MDKYQSVPKSGKRTELEESRLFNEAILNSSPDVIFVFDLIEKRNVYSNEGIMKVLGYSPEEIKTLGDALIETLMHPDDFQIYLNETIPKYQRAKENELIEHSYRMKHKNGSWRWLLAKESVFLRQEDGTPKQIFGILVDITRHKETESLLKKKQYFLQKAQEIGCIGTWELDIEKNELSWTEENYKIFGIPVGTKLTYERFLKCVHPDDRAYVDREWKKSFESKSYDIEHRLLVDGAVKWVREKAELEFNDKGDCIRGTGVTQDITERRLSEQNYQMIFNEMLDGYALHEIICNAQGKPVDYRFLAVNPSFERMTGLRNQDINNKTVLEVLPDIEYYWIETYGRVALTGEPEYFENYSKELNKHFEVTTFRPAPGQFACIFKDITERKQMETHIQQTQKMEAIGTLAGGIAHDFNNMLGVITGNISYALSNPENTDELKEILSDVQEASAQAQNLTQQLLTFAKGGAPIKKVSNINMRIKETAVFSTRGVNANCLFELAEDLWPVEVDAGQMNQVISNLIINANQAMPEGGTITVRTENADIDAESGLSLPTGKYIRIVIKDQGVGISEKHILKIFDPYFTTKQTGSGLGLATTYSIIKKHGGLINVHSEIEQGTVFTIYLPASPNDVENLNQTTEHNHFRQGRILIMDDQESLLKMAERLLSRMGYKTTFATHGGEAIEIYRNAYHSQTHFDLVILDLTVPDGLGGVKTLTELLKINPNLKTLVSSGYSNDPVMSNYKDYGFCGVVPKPYTKAQLSEVLNTILNNND